MDNNTKLHLIDKSGAQDIANIKKTVVKITDTDTGEELFVGSNKVVVNGSLFGAMKYFNLDTPVNLPTYNEILGLDYTVTENSGLVGLRREEKICLFAIGKSGCGPQANQVYDVDYKKLINANGIVPFRYPLLIDDVSAEARNIYFGRKTLSNRAAYYFKKFESTPVIKAVYSDGTPVVSSLYDSTKSEPIEVYVEITMKITKEEAREIFDSIGSSDEAVVNQISLVSAWTNTNGGFTYYQDIRPVTQINFPNESLIDSAKGLDITYQIYF